MLLYCPVRDWTRFCYVIGFENIWIRGPHVIGFVADLFLSAPDIGYPGSLCVQRNNMGKSDREHISEGKSRSGNLLENGNKNR